MKVLDLLSDLDINYIKFDHNPVKTAYEDKGVNIPGIRIKSLFLRNRNYSRYYMAVLDSSKKFNSKFVRHSIGENKLIFVNEDRIYELIGVRPGYISPLALINDKNHIINVIIDESLKNKKIGLHPLRNDQTVVLNTEDLEKFLKYLGNNFFYLKM